MNRLQIFRLLRRNAKLSEKRSPAFDQNVVAKVLLYIGAAIIAIYMIVLGSILGKVSAEEDSPAIMLFALPWLLLIDFFLRFLTQQTPMLFVKPYLIMPIKTQNVVECYLLTIVTSGYNLLWLCLFLPFAFVCIVAGTNVLAVLAVVVCGMLMVMANSLWYLLVRTLIMRSLLWWLLPLAVYAVILLPILLPIWFSDSSIGTLLEDVADVLNTTPMLWLMVIVMAGILFGLLMINRKVQMRFVREEIAHEQKKAGTMKHVAKFTFLERFGMTGEYLKLELKSIMRNKAIRTRVVMSLALMVMFSVLISFTSVYDQKFMLNFWCFYCFSIYGVTALTKVMGPEGNYIDLLMTQRENILMLLRAKYCFHVVILIVPFAVMLSAVFAGKFSILMMLASMMLTCGLVYFMLFQLAVYNKQTLPLDQKITGKNNIENGIQIIIELAAMFVPLILMGLFLALLPENTAYIVLTLIGLLFAAASPLWMRNIYRRMMKRKYVNMEGFHASR